LNKTPHLGISAKMAIGTTDLNEAIEAADSAMKQKK